MFQHLLVPLDGSKMSEAVLPLTAMLAEKSGARVTLLHVVERDAPATVHDDRHLTTAGEAEAYLREIAAKSFPPAVRVGWHVHRRQTTDVAHSLAEHADELEPDLIVMLSHGRRPLRQWLFGTVAQQVIRQTPTPLLLVKPAQDGQAQLPFQRLLVPLDGRPEHEAGLPVAADFARLFQGSVHLLTVVPTWSSLSGPEASTGQLLPSATREMLELAEQQGVEYLGAHLERLQGEGLTASATVARGDPADMIAEAAARHGADLVVLGTHGAAGTQAFWSGSLGQRLLARIPASFVLAPAPGR